MKPELEIFDCEQRSEEWFQRKLGIPSASMFSDILAQGDGKSRDNAMYTLVGELMSGAPAETYTNGYMQRGNDMEAEARSTYEFAKGVEVQRVGFIRRKFGRAGALVGCSPDGLVGDEGVLEIKTMMPKLLARLIDSGRFPTEHRAQCQGALWVTGRQWCDLVVFYRRMPMALFRIERDEKYIDTLAREVEIFDYDLRQMLKRIKDKAR